MPKTYYYKKIRVFKYTCPICFKDINFDKFETINLCNWDNKNNPCKKYIDTKKYILDENFDIVNKEKNLNIVKIFDNKCKLLVDNIVIGTAIIYPEIKIEIENIEFYEIFMTKLLEAKEINFVNIEDETEDDMMFM